MNRAIRYYHYGDPSALQLEDVPAPAPGPGQVRVRVHAAGLNPVDAKTLAGPLPIRVGEALTRLRHPIRHPRFPRGIGKDFAGTIDALGPDVTTVSLGQPVLGTLHASPFAGATWGSLTDLLVAPATMVTPIPEGLDMATAAALGVAAETATGALRTLHIDPDDVLAISGASGGVGSLVTQLAHHAGATVIGIAGPDSTEYLHSLGATPINHHDDIPARLRELDTPPTAFLDCYGGPYVAIARTLGIPRDRIATLIPTPRNLLHGATFTGSRHAHPDDLAHVAHQVATHTMTVRIDHTTPLEIHAIRDAYTALLAGYTHGKIITTLT